MADAEIVAMAWGETGSLAATGVSASSTRDRLYAVVAKFAMSAKATNRRTSFRTAQPPRVDQTAAAADYAALAAVIDNIDHTTWTPPLPKRAALLEVEQSSGKLL